MILLIFAFALLILPLRWIIAAVLAATVHELGHYAALRLCGVPVGRLRIGTGGASMQVGHMGRLQTVICALAGPVAGLSLVMLARWLPRTAVCACIQSIYNLLPVYPLDGGRVIRCIGLPERLCIWIEWICIGIIAIMGIYGWLGLRLGVTSMLIALMTIQRALTGKGLEMRRVFRYNRVRIDE